MGLHRDGTERTVAYGHHRTPHRRGEALPLRVKDSYSGRIVGYYTDSRMRSSLAVAALENARTGASPGRDAGASGHGSQSEYAQYRSRRFVDSLPHRGMTKFDGQSRCAHITPHGVFPLAAAEKRTDRRRWLTRQELRLGQSRRGSSGPTTAGEGSDDWGNPCPSNREQ